MGAQARARAVVRQPTVRYVFAWNFEIEVEVLTMECSWSKQLKQWDAEDAQNGTKSE